MPHISLPDGLPGIRGPMAFRPETAKPLNELAELLLRSDNSLSRGDRELIATYVSSLNACTFCWRSHAAVAACHLGDETLVDSAIASPEHAGISEKLKALLAVAARVQLSGRMVTPEDIARARSFGATDIEIHDTVLIAAAFCMFNRYVDGLAAVTPTDPAAYRDRAALTAERGYSMGQPPV